MTAPRKPHASGPTQTDDARRKAGRVPVRVWLSVEEAEALRLLVASGSRASQRDAIGAALLAAARRVRAK